MNLTTLTDDDLAGLTTWCAPLSTMDNPALSRWGEAAWHCCRDEAQRRVDGGDVPAWPAADSLPTEGVVLIARLLTGVHDAGSEHLAAWVEAFGEALVDTLMARADPDD